MSAPVAAFAIFIMGVVIIMISVIGSFAVQIESRGLLRLMMIIVFVFAVLFIGFGAAGLIQVRPWHHCLCLSSAHVYSLLHCGFVALACCGDSHVSVVCITQSNTLLTTLSNKWDTIRRFLPPTFAGKYDKHQFEVFLEANLLLLGFLSLCTGLVLAVQVSVLHTSHLHSSPLPPCFLACVRASLLCLLSRLSAWLCVFGNSGTRP